MISTVGTQEYTGAVTLEGHVTFDAPTATFDAGLDVPSNDTITLTGGLTLYGNVSNSGTLIVGDTTNASQELSIHGTFTQATSVPST